MSAGRVVSCLLAIATLVALVMVFVFGYMAVFEPGPSPTWTDASMVTFALTLLLGFSTALVSAIAWDVDL